MLSGNLVINVCKTCVNIPSFYQGIKSSLNKLFINTDLLAVYATFIPALIHGIFSRFESVMSGFLHSLHRTNNYNNNLIKYIATYNGGF